MSLKVEDVFTDEHLGRYLHENKMLSRKDMDAYANIKKLPESQDSVFFQVLGLTRRANCEGVYTENGYSECINITEEVSKK